MNKYNYYSESNINDYGNSKEKMLLMHKNAALKYLFCDLDMGSIEIGKVKETEDNFYIKGEMNLNEIEFKKHCDEMLKLKIEFPNKIKFDAQTFLNELKQRSEQIQF